VTTPGKLGIQNITARRICLILVLCVSSVSGTLELVEQSSADTIKHDANAGDDTLYYLDIGNPSISQPIEPTSDGVEGAKFVQVEVAQVLNPNKHALTFEVHYQPKGNVKIYLGSFSLYPADNPGKFIVPTQGKVKNEGAIVLSMVIVDKVAAGDRVKVGVKRMQFSKEQVR
jgi:hypothetical protein